MRGRETEGKAKDEKRVEASESLNAAVFFLFFFLCNQKKRKDPTKKTRRKSLGVCLLSRV